MVQEIIMRKAAPAKQLNGVREVPDLLALGSQGNYGSPRHSERRPAPNRKTYMCWDDS